MTPPVTAKVPRPTVTEIEDVQGRADTRRLPINRVGIKDIMHPVRVRDRSAGEQHTIATFNMYVSLPHNYKGTHMSRFVEILHTEREISVESFRAMLGVMTERAYNNPKFVEDMVRDVAARMNADERIGAYVVESENFESIHNHSAYAMIERDKLAGEPPAA